MENGVGETLEIPNDNGGPDRPVFSPKSEQPELAGAHHVKKNLQGHNHPANWGKMVPGCNGCTRVLNQKQAAAKAAAEAPPPVVPTVQAAPEPKAETITVPAPTPSTQGVYLTFEQLQALMAGQGQSNLAESLKEFAKELRKPDEEEMEIRTAAKARKESIRAMRIVEITAEEDAKAARKARCAQYGHAKENGKSAVHMGQVFADGYHHPMCHRCGADFPLVKPAPGAN